MSLFELYFYYTGVDVSKNASTLFIIKVLYIEKLRYGTEILHYAQDDKVG